MSCIGYQCVISPCLFQLMLSLLQLLILNLRPMQWAGKDTAARSGFDPGSGRSAFDLRRIGDFDTLRHSLS